MARRAKRTSTAASSWRPSPSKLLVLEDQGAPVSLSAVSLAAHPNDRIRTHYTRSFISANRSQLSSLDIAPEFTMDEEANVRLRPGAVVGAVPLKAPDTHRIAGGIVVKPRFGWNGIGVVLNHVGWSASPNILDLPLVPGSAQEVPAWVIAGPILQRIGQLVREIRNGFRMHEEVRQTPRGQILWHRYVTEQAARGAFHELPCRYPELGPDIVLQGYLRWGLQQVYCSLQPYTGSDLIARRLLREAENMLFLLRNATSRAPDHRSLDHLLRSIGLASQALLHGLEALGWIVDERGLGGTTPTDGLSWRMPMHELFERWVEHIARVWAHGFGGIVKSAYNGETTVPISWSRHTRGSMGSLVPDIVVRHRGEVFVIDAKYKGHFEELDDRRWAELSEDIKNEHRHDLHQVVAYAALFDATCITAILAYPMRANAWQRLAAEHRTVVTGLLDGGGRRVRLVLAAVPLELPTGVRPVDIGRAWSAFQLF